MMKGVKWGLETLLTNAGSGECVEGHGRCGTLVGTRSRTKRGISGYHAMWHVRVTSRGRSREHRVLPVTCSVTPSLYLSFPHHSPLVLFNGCIPSPNSKLSIISLLTLLFHSVRPCLFSITIYALWVLSFFFPPIGLKQSTYKTANSTGIQAPLWHEDAVMIVLVRARFDDVFILWRLRSLCGSFMYTLYTYTSHPPGHFDPTNSWIIKF